MLQVYSTTTSYTSTPLQLSVVLHHTSQQGCKGVVTNISIALSIVKGRQQ